MKRLGQSLARGLLLGCVSLLVCAAAASADYEQGFESLAGSGWTTVDLSEGPHVPWTQGAHDDVDSWGAHSGLPDSFVNSSLFPSNPDDAHSAQSDWLISPEFSTLSNGDLVSFYMRARSVIFKLLYTHESFEVRVSTNGSCSPGSTSDSVGDFDKLLLSLDTGTYYEPFTGPPPHYASPEWRELAVALSGLPDGDNSGCIAIRHATPDQWGASPLVGVDDFKLADRGQLTGEIEPLNPVSPAAGTESVGILRGRADVGSTVHFYSDPSCVTPESNDMSADAFQWPGRFTWVEPDVPVRIYANLTLADGSTTECKKIYDYVYDTTAPVTTDDVDQANIYPAPVHLTAVDPAGIARTYYAVFRGSELPGGEMLKYNPANPPVLAPGDRIAYFSADTLDHVESVKYSAVAPTPPATGDVSSAQTGKSEIGLSSRALRLVNGRVRTRLACAAVRGSSTCRGTVGLKFSVRRGGKTKVIRSSVERYSIASGRGATVSLRLSSAAQRYLPARAGASIRAQVVVTPQGSANAKTFRRTLRR